MSDISLEEAIGLIKHICILGEISLHRCGHYGCRTRFLLPLHSSFVVVRNNMITHNEYVEKCDICGECYCRDHSYVNGFRHVKHNMYKCNNCATQNRPYVRLYNICKL
jgi:hypothetical protein